MHLRILKKLLLFSFSRVGQTISLGSFGRRAAVNTGETGIAAINGNVSHSTPPGDELSPQEPVIQITCAVAMPATVPIRAISAPAAVRPIDLRKSPFASGSSGPIYGALDLGTNNCRLLVARASRRGFLRHRRFLPHYKARRRCKSVRLPLRGGNRAHHRCAENLLSENGAQGREPFEAGSD